MIEPFAVNSYLVINRYEVVEEKREPFFQAFRNLGARLGRCEPALIAYSTKTFKTLSVLFEQIKEGKPIAFDERLWRHLQNLPENWKYRLESILGKTLPSSVSSMQTIIAHHYLTHLGSHLGVSVAPLLSNKYSYHEKKAFVHSSLHSFFKWLLEQNSEEAGGSYYRDYAYALTQATGPLLFVLTNTVGRLLLSHEDAYLALSAYFGHIENFASYSTSEERYLLIMRFCALGGQETPLEWLVYTQHVDINKTVYSRETLLKYAALGGQIAFTENLLSHYHFSVSSLLEKDRDGLTLFHSAALGGQIDYAEWLLTLEGVHSSELNTLSPGKHSVLHWTAQGGHKEFLLWLINTKGFNIRTKSAGNHTVLECAAKGGHKELIIWLAGTYGFNIHRKDLSESSLLFSAAWGGHWDLSEWLIASQGLDPKHKNKSGATVLHLAARGGYLHYISQMQEKYGLEIGAKDHQGASLLHYAAYGNNVNLLEHLYTKEALDIHSQTTNGQTALHYAAQGKGVNAFRWLYDQGVSINGYPWKNCPDKEVRKHLKNIVGIKEQPWPYLSPPMKALAKSLRVPIGLQVIPQPKVSWERLKVLASAYPRYSQGFMDLYFRISNTRSEHSINGSRYYPRMKKYVGHLLHYARENKEEAEVIYTTLAEMQGRCGGILEEIEQLYLVKCTKVIPNTVINALEHIGWKWRQEKVSAYMTSSPFSQYVNYSHGFRKAIAPLVGIVPPQEKDENSEIAYDEVEECTEELLHDYPMAIVKILMEHIKTPLKNFTLGEGLEQFDEALILEMFKNNCFSASFVSDLKRQLMQFKVEIKDPKKKIAWEQRLYIDPNNAFFHQLDLHKILDILDSTDTPFSTEIKALRAAFLYPIYRQHVTPENVIEYLQKIEWLEPV